MARSGTLLLHIGAPKTGSTSVQAFLRRNATVLARRYDLLYPEVVWDAPPRDLQAYALFPRVDKRTSSALGSDWSDPEAFVEGYRRRMQKALAGAKCSRVVVSSELLASLGDEGVQRLFELLSPEFDVVRVIFYIRRQDQLELSAYLQAFKGGYEDGDRFSRPLIARRPSYKTTIERFERAFGREAMVVRVYDRASFPGGDVVRDFLELVLGKQSWDALSFSRERNPTWGVRQLAVARILNPLFHPARAPSGLRLLSADPRRLIETLPPGERFLPSRAEAKAFTEQFLADDEWVRRRYFPERELLFDDSFEAYPEEGSSLDLSPGEFEQLVREVWNFHQEELEAIATEGPLYPVVKRLVKRVAPRWGERLPRRVLGAARIALGAGRKKG